MTQKSEQEPLGLYELNRQIRLRIQSGFPESIWVTAEISDCSVNRNGHCYLELIEKDPNGDRIMARSRATIWASAYRMLSAYFETATGQALVPGIKILVKADVEFHELYAVSLNIRDIDPSYTLGDLARKRQMIIRQLEEAGVFGMNKGLDMPLVPQKVAVISSPTAAGYGDFKDQLKNNASGYIFYTRLFPAVMQGTDTVPSIIAALDTIARFEDFFDTVVIIRGGGSKLDLSSFDHYELGMNVAQFPLPVITGIGHEQDDSIIDLVAHTRCKTPTAVAEYLISRVEAFQARLDESVYSTIELVQALLTDKKNVISRVADHMRLRVNGLTNYQQLTIKQLQNNSKTFTAQYLRTQRERLLHMEQVVVLKDPVNLLKQGYSITLVNGKLVKSVKQACQGDTLTTKLADGQIVSIVSPG